MEELTSLKRPPEFSEDLCVICQEKKKENLVKCTEQGVNKLISAAQERKSYKDISSQDIIDRILNRSSIFKWHRPCYSWFTHKEKIKRLQKSFIDVQKVSPQEEGVTMNLRIMH